ncbi:MAG: hypothetical protein LUD29_02865 [Clostridia bacterium]|nr:hypothetical protein [Clostridia bacterium]
MERKLRVFKNLRITSGILAACGVVATFFVFVFCELLWGFIALIITLIFVALTFVFRSKQRQQENITNPPPPQGDFITGKINSDKNENNGDKSQ